jgi:hypothetical protein
MRSFWTYAVALTASALLLACGGGSGGSGGTSDPLVNVADCFQVNASNSFRYTSTSSPSQAQTLLTPGATSSTTYNYENTVADVAYRSDFFNGALALSRSSAGTDTYTTTSAIAPRQFTDSEFFTTTPTFTILGSKSSYPSISYLSETVFSGFGRALSFPSGQAQNYTYIATKTFAVLGSTPSFSVSTITHTVTFLVRENLDTPAGTFKNACKFSLEIKTPPTPVASTPATASSTAASSAGTSSTVWYAPGWGLVKQDSVERFTDGRVPASVSKSSAVTVILSGSL